MGHTYTPNLGVIQRTITNCLSFNNHGVNGEIGFDQSEVNCMAWIVNNVAYHNLNSGFFNDVDGVVSTFRNNISYANGVVDVFESAQVRDHDSWTINSGGYTVTDNDFLSVDWTGTDGRRNSDGSLPTLNFLKLKVGSGLIGTGVNVGLTYDGAGNLWIVCHRLGDMNIIQLLHLQAQRHHHRILRYDLSNLIDLITLIIIASSGIGIYDAIIIAPSGIGIYDAIIIAPSGIGIYDAVTIIARRRINI